MAEIRTENDLSGHAMRVSWLNSHDLHSVTPEPLPADASPRRYFRLPDTGLLLVQVPPGDTDQPVFTRVAEHLNGLGLSAPKTRVAAPAEGLYLVEDFGPRTFSSEIDRGRPEAESLRVAGPSHRRRLDHADADVGQHQRALDHDRRESLEDGVGGGGLN